MPLPLPWSWPLGRLLYFAHLAIVLGWLLDRSPGQRATAALLGVADRVLAPVALALRLPSTRSAVLAADRAVREAWLETAVDPPGSADA